MRIKHTVSLQNLQPQMALAAVIVAECYRAMGYEAAITSANDSEHGRLSRHHWGGALDFRTKNVENHHERQLIENIIEALGPEFNVLFEDKDTDNEHLHVSYRP